MEPELALELVGPYTSELIGLIREGHGDWDLEVGARVRASVHGAFPKFTFGRHIDLLAQRFGRDMRAERRVQNFGRNEAFVINGIKGAVALRIKKLNSRTGLSSNHRSERQDYFRATGRMDLFGEDIEHLICGYEDVGDSLQRSLRRIVVQSERQALNGAYYIAWSHPIWDVGRGQTGGYVAPPNIFMPPPDVTGRPGFRVKVKKQDGSQTGDQSNTDAG